MRPVHVKSAQASLFKYLHAIAFDGDLTGSVLCPLTEPFLSVVFSYHNDVKWFATAKITDGHLMKGGARRYLGIPWLFARRSEMLQEVDDLLVVFTGFAVRDSDHSHQGTHGYLLVSMFIQYRAKVYDEIPDCLF